MEFDDLRKAWKRDFDAALVALIRDGVVAMRIKPDGDTEVITRKMMTEQEAATLMWKPRSESDD